MSKTPELMGARTRAKAGWIATKRYDKGGKVVEGRDALVPMQGMFDTREAERVMRDVAAEHGADESQIRIEYYDRNRQAPMEVNPRHRGRPGNGRLWSGWTPPRRTAGKGAA